MRFASALIAAMLSLQAEAQEVDLGRLLYETHCSGCHYERVHERTKSPIRSLEQLRAEVSRWARQTRRPFSTDEFESIVDYLNRSHYKLKQ